MRSIGEGSSITNNTKTYATILLNHNYGDVFDTTRRKPFDFIDFVAEMNFGEKVGLGNVQIRGNLASWPLGSSTDHVLALVQHFDYMNNTAYEFGGQSVGGALSSRFRLSDKVVLKTRLDADGILLGGSQLGVRASTPWSAIQERAPRVRLRPGPRRRRPGRTSSLSGHPLLSALYRFAWISVTNGSVYNVGTVGSDADHYIQIGGLRLVIPIKGSLGIGADAYVFLRDSYFSLTDSATGQQVAQHIRQRNPQARVYFAVSH